MTREITEVTKLIMDSYDKGAADTKQSAIEAIELAIKLEREACAKTVEKIETYEKIEKACFKFAAKTIRARGEA